MTLTKRQIDYLTGRFLNWRFPMDIDPDGGISIDRTGERPTGTNLLNGAQAEAMVKYMADGLPAAEPGPAPETMGAVDIEALKNRPHLRLGVMTDDEVLRVGEMRAARTHNAYALCNHVKADGHAAVESLMIRIRALGAEIRAIEDAAMERDRIRRNAPLEVDMSALDLSKAEGDGNT